MAKEQFANDVADVGTTVASGLNNTTNPVTFTVADGGIFPSSGNFRLVCESEILLATARSGNSITASRGQEGTSAASHADSTEMHHVLTKGSIEQARLDFLALGLCEGRLTLESGVPVSITDQTSKLIVYFTPFRGNRIALYDGAAWQVLALAEISIKATDTAQTGVVTSGSPIITDLTDTSQLIVGMNVTGATGSISGTIASIDSATQITCSANASQTGTKGMTFTLPTNSNFDVFGYISAAGAVKLEWGPAWTNATTRATALTTQDGVLVKSGAVTRRYLGSIRTGLAGETADQALKRYLWSYYNRARKTLERLETNVSWSVTSSGVVRQAGNSAVNQVELIVGAAEVSLVLGLTTLQAGTTISYYSIIGEDGATVITAGVQRDTSGQAEGNSVALHKLAPLGYHTYFWNEKTGANAVTVYGVVNGVSYGLRGSIDC